MKKLLAVSAICAFLSVTFCFLFLGQTILRIPLWAGLSASFALSAASLVTTLSFFKMESSREVSPPAPEAARPTSAAAPAGKVRKKGYEVYLRAVECMETKKPYLDEKLDLEQFAKAIFSNKAYVSKNVNLYSGRNFRKFVNSYRIQYAVELMMKDPHLRMEEVSTMSGFHSPVSFNMAFRLFQGKTPTQWHEEYVDSLRKH